MITSIADFLRYFDAVHRRAVRDIAALPSEADGWAPSVGEGEGAWSVNVLIGHMAGARIYFASAYRGEGWIWGEATADPADQRTWLPWLEQSAERFGALLRETPEDWLTRRVDMIDTPGATLSGWRLLMMMIEHEVHHRSQIDSYAGLEGWPVPDIFNRSAESIDALQSGQRARHGG